MITDFDPGDIIVDAHWYAHRPHRNPHPCYKHTQGSLVVEYPNGRLIQSREHPKRTPEPDDIGLGALNLTEPT